MTNYEKIKNMSIDEMAKSVCNGHKGCEGCAFMDCPNSCAREVEQYKNWLLAESKPSNETYSSKQCPHYQGVCSLDESIVCYRPRSYETCDIYIDASDDSM